MTAARKTRGGAIPAIQPDQGKGAGSTGGPPARSWELAQQVGGSASEAVEARLQASLPFRGWLCGAGWALPGAELTGRMGLWASIVTSLPWPQGLCGWRWELGDTVPLALAWPSQRPVDRTDA